MGKIINPATDKPFVEVSPSNEVIRIREEIKRALRSRYDAEKTTSQNELHWANADMFSPNTAHNLATRSKIRSRARYESANSGYLKGILLTLANDFTGGGPSLQITDPRFSDTQKRTIERLWLARSKSIKLRQKLWQMRYARTDSGEAFGVYYTDRRSKLKTKITFRTIECDHFQNSDYSPKNRYEIDAVRIDRSSGQPTQYWMLDDHPGESEMYSIRQYGGKWIDADNVIHWFRKERPWLRGIPETTTTLPLWALLRRYTLAVVQNAEIAADFTVLLKSMQPVATNPFTGNLDTANQQAAEDWFDSFPIDRGLMTVLPSMYDMTQLKPEQPCNMYDGFINALVQEAARPLCVPRNMALGYSGGYNMASGALDRQVYAGTHEQDRLGCNEDILDKDFYQWWYEAIRLDDYLDDDRSSPEKIRAVVNRYPSLREITPEHTYRWDEISEHTDPVKVAHAMNLLHIGGHLSDTDIQEGRFNRPVEEHYENLERQQNRRKELGMLNTPDSNLVQKNSNSEKEE